MSDDFEPVTYSAVNGAWGGAILPAITAAQSAEIGLKLLRKFGPRRAGSRRARRPWFYNQVNRSWAAPKGTDTSFDHENGLPAMIHDLSHWVHGHLHPLAKTHCAPHAALEKAMIDCVIAKGWHLPRPKKVKARRTVDDKLASTRAAIKRWQTKAKRAATALRKLQLKERRLARSRVPEALEQASAAP